MKCEGYGKNEKSYKTLLESVQEKDGLRDRGVDGTTILNWTAKTVCGLDSSAYISALAASCFEDSNEISGSIKAKSFLDCGLLGCDSA
jgi:hypothetical protein